MEEKKYNKILTVILIIVVIAICIIIGFWIYDAIHRHNLNAGLNEAVDEFDNLIINNNNNNENQVEDENIVGLEINVNDIQNTGTSGGGGRGTVARQTYKGFAVVGKIEIPAIKVNYPVLDRATDPSMKVSVGVLYGVGLNKVGNTVIAGHNYRNGTFFSKNKNLKNGDLIYITDLNGTRIKYTIYNIYHTSSSDFDYAARDTAGKREVSLTTCTDDVNARLVIWAKED